MPFVLLITGGIAGGKSTVAECFAKLGADVIDVDIISRQITAKDGVAIEPIKQTFGEIYIYEGELNRAKMRELIFNDCCAKKKLEEILHPIIKKEKMLAIKNSKSELVVVQVPLFIETGANRQNINQVLTVETSPETQINRLKKNRGFTQNIAEKIINSQAHSFQRIAQADVVINNITTLSDLQISAAYYFRRIFAESCLSPIYNIHKK